MRGAGFMPPPGSLASPDCRCVDKTTSICPVSGLQTSGFSRQPSAFGLSISWIETIECIRPNFKPSRESAEHRLPTRWQVTANECRECPVRRIPVVHSGPPRRLHLCMLGWHESHERAGALSSPWVGAWRWLHATTRLVSITGLSLR